MPSPDITLVARGLERHFGTGEAQTIAVSGAALTLHRGEVCLLMGPSGSGKSTLLAMLAGLLQPNAGEVWALGENLWRLSEPARERFRLKHCGFVFQAHNLFPSLTAREQLELVARWTEGISAAEARKRVDMILRMLGIGGRADLLPIQLSGGEKQRVAIGRALLKNPPLCFADEPTSSLDWAHGEHVVELLCDAARQSGSTVLIVTHDSRLVPYADRVFHMQDGLVEETTRRPEPRYRVPTS